MSKAQPEVRLQQAQMRLESAKSRLSTTTHALEYRLSPSVIAHDVLNGVYEKGSRVGDDAVQAVKDRPLLASGVGAAIALFLARKPIGRMMSRMRSGEQDQSIIRADLVDHDEDYDLTAPTAPSTFSRSTAGSSQPVHLQGVS